MDAADEMKELKERAEEAREKGMIEVSFSMAVLAVVIALLTMLGHRAHTEEGILQTKAADQWAYYQAKNNQRAVAQLGVDLLSLDADDPGPRGVKARESLAKHKEAIEKYNDKKKDIDAEARKMEDEVALQSRRAARFDYGETLLAMALVISSLTLMTNRRIFWLTGLALAVIGTIYGLSAFLIR